MRIRRVTHARKGWRFLILVIGFIASIQACHGLAEERGIALSPGLRPSISLRGGSLATAHRRKRRRTVLLPVTLPLSLIRALLVIIPAFILTLLDPTMEARLEAQHKVKEKRRHALDEKRAAKARKPAPSSTTFTHKKTLPKKGRFTSMSDLNKKENKFPGAG